jgi:superfamily II DNA or RNA helicase
MYKIIVDSVHSRIEPTLPAEVSTRLNEDLRYHPDGYQHTWYFKNKKWDGYEYLFSMVNQTFRTGLLWRVGLRLKKDNIPFEIIDIRTYPEKISHLSSMNFGDITPYQYQINAAESTLNESHGVIASPTGTGKTLIMQLIVKLHQYRTLIVTNSRTLLDQTFEAFDQVLPGKVGIIGSGDFELGDVTIATIQSLATILRLSEKQKKGASSWKEEPLLEWLRGVGLVIHDEVHEADSASVDKLYNILPASKFIGTTATPYAWAHTTERGKNLEMEQHFGRKIFDSRGDVDFIGVGVIVPIIVTRSVVPRIQLYANWDGKTYDGLEYKDVVDSQVINNELRIKHIAKHAANMVERGMSCYVFYQRIEYGKALCDAMRKYDPVMLQGSTARGDRNQVFKDINDKKQLLAVSDIGSYGLNIKSLDNIIIAYPSKDARQIIGRVCRSFPGKQYGYVTDIVDNVPFLRKHAELRLSQYTKDQHTIIG